MPGYQGKKVVVAHIGKAAQSAGMRLASDLRRAGVPAVLGPVGRGLRSQLRYASSIDATHAAILGDEELETGMVVLRDLGLGEQHKLANNLDALVKRIGEASV